jgi:UDP-glucose 6-dehydrogenase
LRCEGLMARFVKQNALPQPFAGRGVGADRRRSPRYIRPGHSGSGGSCTPGETR